MTPDIQVMLPVLIAVGSAMVALVADAFSADKRVAVAVTVAGLVAAASAAMWVAWEIPGATPAFGAFEGGGAVTFTVGLIMSLAALSLIGGWATLTAEKGGGAAAALVGFAAGASAALAHSVDLVMTLIALETIAVCAYALIGASPGLRAREAGMKYVIQGALATGLILLGTAILLGLYGGSGGYDALAGSIAGATLLPAAAGGALVLGAFAFKLGAVPFHAWAPDAFETARPAAGAFLASAPKLGALVGVFVIVSRVLVGNIENLAYGIAALATLSIVVGNLGGLRQRSYTRLLGYSGIAQIGYALVGLTIGVALGPRGVPLMLALTLVLVAAYAIAAVGAFVAAEAFRRVRPSWDGTVDGLAGIGTERPLLGVSLAACMFSLTGIPLTAGFWGKLLVFGVAASRGWLWLALIGVVGSVISFGYYGRVLRTAFFDPAPRPSVEPASQASRGPAPEASPELGPGRISVAETVVVAVALVVIAVGVMPLFTGIDALVALFAR